MFKVGLNHWSAKPPKVWSLEPPPSRIMHTDVVLGCVPITCSGKWSTLCSWRHNVAKTTDGWRGNTSFLEIMLLPILLKSSLVVLCTEIRRPRRWSRFRVALYTLASREFTQGASSEGSALGHERTWLAGRSSIPPIATRCRGTDQKKPDKREDKFYFNAICTSSLWMYIRTYP